jgi:hypothetical protein
MALPAAWLVLLHAVAGAVLTGMLYQGPGIATGCGHRNLRSCCG